MMDFVVVMKLTTTLLRILNLVETSVLKFRRKTFLHSDPIHLLNKHTRSIQPIDVLLK